MDCRACTASRPALAPLPPICPCRHVCVCVCIYIYMCVCVYICVQGKETSKTVFVVYYQGSEDSALRVRIMNVCGAYGVRLYPWPRTSEAAARRVLELSSTIEDKEKAHLAYELYFLGEIGVLLEVTRPGGNSLVEELRLFCLKEKTIYGTLNLFEGSDLTLRADCWFPASEEDGIRRLLLSNSGINQVSAFLLTDAQEPKQETPPTYNRTTEFTEGFQGMIDTYGVPRYGESNPALLTMITFPFLFGIMYGDIGHGICVLIFGAVLVATYRPSSGADNEMLGMLAGGRYIILLMGLFATYSGFMYNDFLSVGFNIFGTRYNEAGLNDQNATRWSPNLAGEFPYPVGFDPIWKGAVNEVEFMNSFKMKFAVIVGGIQMTAGVIMKALNAIHERSGVDFVFEFLPQITLLLCLVGYMNVLIVWKWATPITPAKEAASLISTVINMCMMQAIPPEKVLYPAQDTVQMVILGLMLAAIPIMLIPKPFILKVRNDRMKLASREREEEMGILDAELGSNGGGGNLDHAIVDGYGGGEKEEEFDFMEIFIHQLIETIEFTLSVISNTASYLRLWALSLAHQQLSVVFFDFTVMVPLRMEGYVVKTIVLFFVFGVFAMLTFGIMLGMDTLECYLHALRLQWVEFQNKFFRGDGRAFAPLSFKTVLSAQAE
eukprot:GHVU01068827.1.p1 GENE.GHVU01068827.1~~GHVU01068827.1.p1  ORF type:complete len:663 (+),score=122.14 GHVU01068827.1:4033-6021(+)